MTWLVVLGSILGLPAMVFIFVYSLVRKDTELKKLKYQKEILELEIQKQNNQIKLLEEENKKYDTLIKNS
jgi:hypothetical protein